MSSADDQQDGQFVQRIVSAADCALPATLAANSIFNWHPDAGSAPAGADDETPADPDHLPQEDSMVKRKRANRALKTVNGSPQHQVCTALLAGGRTRKQLAELLPALSSNQISSALNNAKTLKRVVLSLEDKLFKLTERGQAWVTSCTPQGEPAPAASTATPAPMAGSAYVEARARRESAAAARAEVELAKLDTSPASTATKRRAFRCAVTNDGCFLLSKDGAEIELDPEEHAQMLHYLERMAEQPA